MGRKAVGQAERLQVKCRARSGPLAELDVLDLSPGGCMVACRGWAAKMGERVLTTLPGLAALPSELVWLEDGRAGLAFEHPLHEAVFDRLSARLAR